MCWRGVRLSKRTRHKWSENGPISIYCWTKTIQSFSLLISGCQLRFFHSFKDRHISRNSKFELKHWGKGEGEQWECDGGRTWIVFCWLSVLHDFFLLFEQLGCQVHAFAWVTSLHYTSIQFIHYHSIWVFSIELDRKWPWTSGEWNFMPRPRRMTGNQIGNNEQKPKAMATTGENGRAANGQRPRIPADIKRGRTRCRFVHFCPFPHFPVPTADAN